MNKLTEGKRMWLGVISLFAVFALVFIIFEDFDRNRFSVLDKAVEWHLLGFAMVVVLVVGVVLRHYGRLMDQRISEEQSRKQLIMRRELTQNIAHELKTPVAVIQGYMETLQSQPNLDEATRQRFVDRCLAQSKRLTALLQDIGTLNRMDFATDLITTERVNVADVLDEIIHDTAATLANREMSLRIEVPSQFEVTGNTQLLYSIFRNLIDNAVLYAGKGTEVHITAHDLGDRWHVVVEDNGVGVAQQHLPRLFERFYRVDKGRSRQMGGTGLGLSIVKNAVQLHGGTIAASARPGGGLKLDFDLRK
ncbi:MAG: hypothetical protein IKR25_04480 [Muribaculaceae bacterium]|nr:hypothetical protein [Muribaculaceae bacterium]